MVKKEILLIELNKELESYKFSIKNRVRFAEVDSFGVVHNLSYFYWLEWGRIEYMRNLGFEFEFDTLIKKLPFMSVHAEIDYLNSARFDDEYEVFSKISLVKKSSIEFQNIIRLSSGTILCKASAILVYLNYHTKEPERIPDEIRENLRIFENNLIFATEI